MTIREKCHQIRGEKEKEKKQFAREILLLRLVVSTLLRYTFVVGDVTTRAIYKSVFMFLEYIFFYRFRPVCLGL